MLYHDVLGERFYDIFSQGSTPNHKDPPGGFLLKNNPQMLDLYPTMPGIGLLLFLTFPWVYNGFRGTGLLMFQSALMPEAPLPVSEEANNSLGVKNRFHRSKCHRANTPWTLA